MCFIYSATKKETKSRLLDGNKAEVMWLVLLDSKVCYWSKVDSKVCYWSMVDLKVCYWSMVDSKVD